MRGRHYGILGVCFLIVAVLGLIARSIHWGLL